MKNINHSTLEFFKIIERMIDSGATCSEILEKINTQPYEIKSLFGTEYLSTLRSGGDIVLKDLFTEVKVGIGRSLGETLNSVPPFKLNEFDIFKIFIENDFME
jgi:fatty acid-binding protein DegV